MNVDEKLPSATRLAVTPVNSSIATPAQLRIYIDCAVVESLVCASAIWLFIFAVISQTIRRRNPNINRDASKMRNLWISFALGSILLFFVILHYAGVLARTYSGFFPLGDEEHSLEYFGEQRNLQTRVAEAGQFGAIVFSDIYSLFRFYLLCYEGAQREVKWRLKWRITFMVALVLAIVGSIGLGCWFLNAAVNANDNAGNFQTSLERPLAALLAWTLLISTISTGGAVWFLESEFGSSTWRSLSLGRKFVRLVITFSLNWQTSSPYALFIATYLGLYVRDSDKQSVFSTLVPSMASVTFSLITLCDDHAIYRVNRDFVGDLFRIFKNTQPLENIPHNDNPGWAMHPIQGSESGLSHKSSSPNPNGNMLNFNQEIASQSSIGSQMVSKDITPPNNHESSPKTRASLSSEPQLPIGNVIEPSGSGTQDVRSNYAHNEPHSHTRDIPRRPRSVPVGEAYPNAQQSSSPDSNVQRSAFSPAYDGQKLRSNDWYGPYDQ